MSKRRHIVVLTVGFVINTLLTIVEIIAAVISGSVALKADSFQNLTDSLVLSVAFIGEKAASRPGLKRRDISAIYRRASLVNSLILMSLSVYVGFSAISRIVNPQRVVGQLVIGIGILSIVVNLLAAGLLFTARRDRSTEAPYIGLLFSGLSGLGVCISGIFSVYWHAERVDGAIALVLAFLLLARSSKMLVTSQFGAKSSNRVLSIFTR